MFDEQLQFDDRIKYSTELVNDIEDISLRNPLNDTPFLVHRHMLFSQHEYILIVVFVSVIKLFKKCIQFIYIYIGR